MPKIGVPTSLAKKGAVENEEAVCRGSQDSRERVSPAVASLRDGQPSDDQGRNQIPGAEGVAGSTEEIKPYWTTADGRAVQLYCGDVREVLAKLPEKSVQMVVTSPPYWGLRDYGTAEWEGGDPQCDHKHGITGDRKEGYSPAHGVVMSRPAGWQGSPRCSTVRLGSSCNKCGAKRIDRQIGSEESPDCLGWATGNRCGECHTCVMVDVFQGIWRVLRDDGIVWLNYGDTYAANLGAGMGVVDPRKQQKIYKKDGHKQGFHGGTYVAYGSGKSSLRGKIGLKPGNIVAIPWRVALALQADGWILRQDIVWAKPSPMPESVTNRCTKSHEYVFLLTKQQRYFYDAEAIREELKTDPEALKRRVEQSQAAKKHEEKPDSVACIDRYGATTTAYAPTGRNKRSVWTVAGQGYEGAHFATFPEKLIEPCILAGTSEYGCCAKCGAPWRRVTEQEKLTRERPNDYVKRVPPKLTGGAYSPPGQSPHGNARSSTEKLVGRKSGVPGQSDQGRARAAKSAINTCANTVAGARVKTVGWEPTCTCNGKFVKCKGTRVGYGSYHDHSQDGVQHGMYQDGKGPNWPLPEPDKEFETTVIEYVSDLPLDQHPVRPCIVLDPFMGSGTTASVALRYGRWAVGIDLNPKYLLENAIPRIEGTLMSIPKLHKLLPRG